MCQCKRNPISVRSGISGALMGALLTAPLAALFYLADQAAGLPLVMYDLFDWLTRTIPGEIIPRVIEIMVDIIRGLDLGETSSTAKTIENGLAILTFVGGGVAAGALLFVILRRYTIHLDGSRRYLPGLITAVIMGLPLILISQDVNVTATAPDSASILWLVVAFLVWGALLSWSYYRAFETVPVEPIAEITPAPVRARPRAGRGAQPPRIFGACRQRISDPGGNRRWRRPLPQIPGRPGL